MLEPVIGLEVHVELATASKLFCACSTAFGAPPNSHVCPVCLGLPGSLPVLNARAVDLLMMAALALGCRIAPHSKFDRKNYFYPDMPKNYQISQYDLPLSLQGGLEIDIPGGRKMAALTRIHLEEDTGKSIHQLEGAADAGAPAAAAQTKTRLGGSDMTLVDYNRAGVPLMEIVGEPDLAGPDEAYNYLTALKRRLRWIGVSDCKMEEGSMRCDANVSLRNEDGSFGAKVEVKNMNSFKSVRAALVYEIARQSDLRERHERIVQETRGWDEARGITISQRSKEQAHDYRYFPEPDLPPLAVDEAWLERLAARLPELPEAMETRFAREYELPAYDAGVLTQSRVMAEFFMATVAMLAAGGTDAELRQAAALADEELADAPAETDGAVDFLERRRWAKPVSNWLMGDVQKYLNETSKEINETCLNPGDLAKLMFDVETGKISRSNGKELLVFLMEGNTGAFELKAVASVQISTIIELEPVLDEVLSANSETIAKYKNGNVKVLQFLVGQVMKSTGGNADAKVVTSIIEMKLTGQWPGRNF